MASNRGWKRFNEYANAFGSPYCETPKAVFAAIALSFAVQLAGEEQATWDETAKQAVALVMREWRCLHANGIVPQAPPR